MIITSFEQLMFFTSEKVVVELWQKMCGISPAYPLIIADHYICANDEGGKAPFTTDNMLDVHVVRHPSWDYAVPVGIWAEAYYLLKGVDIRKDLV